MFSGRKKSLIAGSVASVTGLCLATSNIFLKEGLDSKVQGAETLDSNSNVVIQSDGRARLSKTQSLPPIIIRRRNENDNERNQAGRRRRESYEIFKVEDSPQLKRSDDESTDELRQNGAVNEDLKSRVDATDNLRDSRSKKRQDAKVLSKIDEDLKRWHSVVAEGEHNARSRHTRRHSTSDCFQNDRKVLSKSGSTQIFRINARKNGFFDEVGERKTKEDSPVRAAKNENGKATDESKRLEIGQRISLDVPNTDSQLMNDSEILTSKTAAKRHHSPMQQSENTSKYFRSQDTPKKDSLDSLAVGPKNIAVELDSAYKGEDSDKIKSANVLRFKREHSRARSHSPSLGEPFNLFSSPIPKRSLLERLPEKKNSPDVRISTREQSFVVKQDERVIKPEFARGKVMLEWLPNQVGKSATAETGVDSKPAPRKAFSTISEQKLSNSKSSDNDILNRKLSLDLSRLNERQLANGEQINKVKSLNAGWLNEDKSSDKHDDVRNVLNAAEKSTNRIPEKGEKDKNKDKTITKKTDNKLMENGKDTKQKHNKRQKSPQTTKEILRKQEPYDSDDEESYSDDESWKNVKVTMRHEKVKGIMKDKNQNRRKSVTFNNKVKKVVLYCE